MCVCADHRERLHVQPEAVRDPAANARRNQRVAVAHRALVSHPRRERGTKFAKFSISPQTGGLLLV